jgi:TolA-binding protein
MKGGFEELSARARRGELSESDQRQLRVLLASSIEAQLAHRAGCEFDAEDSVLPGDDALAERVTRRLLVQMRPSRLGRLRVGWKLAAAGALTVAAAAAGPGLAERLGVRLPFVDSSAEVMEPATPATDPGAKRSGKPARATPAAEGSAAAMPSSEPDAAESLVPGGSRRVETRARRPRSSVGDAPAALFAEASRARRHGQTSQAIALYQDLQRRHPSAAEAHAADIALGMLYSGRSPRVALTHFRRYLQRGGPLAPEALWGQSQALAALGRTDEAREVWRILLARYPRSTYANAARAKLASRR